MTEEVVHEVGPDRPATQEELNAYFDRVMKAVRVAFQQAAHPHPGNNVSCANAIYVVCTELLLRLVMGTRDPNGFIEHIKTTIDQGFAARLEHAALSKPETGVH